MSRSRSSGPLEVRNGLVGLTAVQYNEDFCGPGKVVIPAAGSAESGMDWVKQITGAAPPTVAGQADYAGGAIAHTLTSASQAQNAALYHGDQRNFLITKPNFSFEARIVVTVLPTLLSKIVVGLAGDMNADPDAITYSAWVAITAAGILAEMDDNATDRSVDSGLDVVANDVVAVRMDFGSVGSVQYYVAINPTAGQDVAWQRIAGATTFAYAATGANATLQPYIAAAKASGAGVGTFLTDSVQIVCSR